MKEFRERGANWNSFMMKRPLVILMLGVALNVFPQTSLTTPSSSGVQCVGADCDRQRSTPGGPPASSSGPALSVPYIQTPPGAERGNDLSRPNSLYPEYRRMPPYEKTEFERF